MRSVLVALIGGAGIAAAVACGGGERSAAPASTSTEPTAMATETAAPATATPSPTPTSPFGVPIVVLHEGDPIPLPEGMVLYYFGGAVPIEGTPSVLLRAYRLGSGPVVIEDVLRNLPVKGERYGYAIDAARQRIAVALCTAGDCFQHYLIATTNTTDTILRSDDGGATWTNLGPPSPPGSRLVGFVGDELAVYVPRTTRPTEPVPQTVKLYPSGRELTGPAGAFPAAIDGQALTWIGQDGTLMDTNGAIIQDALKAPGYMTDRAGSILAPLPDFANAYRTGPNRAHYLVQIDSQGHPLRAMNWGDFDLAAVARVSDDMLVMNRYFPAAGGIGEAALLDMRTGDYQVIGGLRRPEDRDAYPVAAATGSFARVKTGGDCLNLRTKPATDAPVARCLADGAILKTTSGPTAVGGRDWYTVEVPGSGETAFAAAEFVER